MKDKEDLESITCAKLNEVWRTRNLDPASPARRTILDLARLKDKRMGKHPEPKCDGNITTAVIENRGQLEAAVCEPGKGYPGDDFKICFSLVF